MVAPLLADAFSQLMAVLLFWSLLAMGASIAGLYVPAREFWRSFWFMNGMWGLVDGAIVLYSIVGPAPAASELAPILGFNAGLDVVYIAAGVIMLARKSSRIRGFGAAIMVQGIFLLALDLYFWSRCSAQVA